MFDWFAVIDSLLLLFTRWEKLMKFFEVEAASVPKVMSTDSSSEVTETKEEENKVAEEENEGTSNEKKKRVGFRDRKVSVYHCLVLSCDKVPITSLALS